MPTSVSFRLLKIVTPSFSSSSSSSPFSVCRRIRSTLGAPRVFSPVAPSPFRSAVHALSSASAMGDVAGDASMDEVQRRLMFEDDASCWQCLFCVKERRLHIRGGAMLWFDGGNATVNFQKIGNQCILVDETDRVVGHDSKYNCHLNSKIESDNLLHRAFSVFMFNSKYELLLQQRSPKKVTFPLVWTNTCCSHPLYRESELIEEEALGARVAAQRKLFDELGIPAEDIPVDDFVPVGRILYKAPSSGKWGEHELDYLLFIVRDVNVNPNPNEVKETKYVNRKQMQELVSKVDAGDEGLKLSPWFRLIVDNFLYKWWDNVENGTLREVADMDPIHRLT